MKPISLIVTLVTFLTLSASGKDPLPDYDVFDGRGKSGKKLDFVEWAGNLEIHAYPKGSIAGLALKLDKTNKDKPVMVIGLRFDNNPQKQYIRRAILGIPMSKGFKAYRDPTPPDYDKIIITNQGLGGNVQLVNLDPEPKQMYPDGHPAIAKKDEKKEKKRAPAAQSNSQPGKPLYQSMPQSQPAQKMDSIQPKQYEKKPYAQPHYQRDPALEKKKEKKEGNQIRHFSW